MRGCSDLMKTCVRRMISLNKRKKKRNVRAAWFLGHDFDFCKSRKIECQLVVQVLIPCMHVHALYCTCLFRVS